MGFSCGGNIAVCSKISGPFLSSAVVLVILISTSQPSTGEHGPGMGVCSTFMPLISTGAGAGTSAAGPAAPAPAA